MARPRVKLTLISSYVRERERVTAREVAHGVQMSVPDVSRWLHHLQRSGEIAVVERVRVEHAARPVAVYAPVPQTPSVCAHDWFR